MQKVCKKQVAETPLDLDQMILPGDVGVVPVEVLRRIVARRGAAAEPVAAAWLEALSGPPSVRRRPTPRATPNRPR